MTMLDIGCGIGGVSDGYALEGFDVTGIDIVDAPGLLGYKHRFIHADIRDLDGDNFRGFHVIWDSMPCRDFSQMAHVGYGSKRRDCKGKWAWKNPPNPQDGLKLIKASLDFIAKAQPKIWIMENVVGLIPHLEIKPKLITRIEPTKKRAFWGNFPPVSIPMSPGLNIAKNVRGRIYCIQGKNRSWKRAKIPLACSQAFAKACKDALSRDTGFK